MKLEGKVAIVTGAASGFGAASARLFASEGARVLVVDINKAGADEVADGIQAAGGTALACKVDVSQQADVERMIASAVDDFGRVDILYNNAGVPMTPTRVQRIENGTWEHIMDINAKSVFLGVRAAVPIMREQGGGVILSTSSISGSRPRTGLSIYTASKAAVTYLTKSFAVELADYNIRVNCISPVAADTPMLMSFVPERARENPEAAKEGIISSIPLKRLGTAQDVASAALYLVSDDAAFITGVDFYVDGGRSV